MKHLINKESEVTPEPTFPSFLVRYRGRDGQPVPWLASFLITFKGKGVGFALEPGAMNNDLICFIYDNAGTLIELVEVGGNL